MPAIGRSWRVFLFPRKHRTLANFLLRVLVPEGFAGELGACIRLLRLKAFVATRSVSAELALVQARGWHDRVDAACLCALGSLAFWSGSNLSHLAQGLRSV